MLVAVFGLQLLAIARVCSGSWSLLTTKQHDLRDTGIYPAWYALVMLSGVTLIVGPVMLGRFIPHCVLLACTRHACVVSVVIYDAFAHRI